MSVSAAKTPRGLSNVKRTLSKLRVAQRSGNPPAPQWTMKRVGISFLAHTTRENVGQFACEEHVDVPFVGCFDR